MGLIGSKSYDVEFQDDVLDLDGWKNPRYEGCKMTSLYYNTYQQGGSDIKLIGPVQNPDLNPSIYTQLPVQMYASNLRTESIQPWFANWPPKAYNLNITYSNIDTLSTPQNYPSVPTQDYDGDNVYSVLPLIQNSTNTIFLGTNIIGNKEIDLYPTPGPDFSYLKIDKAITFNTEDNTFFIIENIDEDDETFERILQTNLPWASSFQVRLLDYDHPHQLKQKYGTHYNKGMFGLFGKFTAYRLPNNNQVDVNGHYQRGTGEYDSASYDFTYIYKDVFLRDAGQGWEAPTYYGRTTSSYGDIVETQDCQFDIVNRKMTMSGGGTEAPDSKMSGSFELYTLNPETKWWTKLGGTDTISYVSRSYANRHSSFKYFIDTVISQSEDPDPGLYVVTLNDAVNTDTAFRMGVELRSSSNEFQLVNINKPLITFGSFPLSDSKYVGIPNSSKQNTGYYYADPAGTYVTNSAPNLSIPPAYAPTFLKYWGQPHKVHISGSAIYDAGTGYNYWPAVWFGIEHNIFDNHYTGLSSLSTSAIKPFMDNWALYKLDKKPNVILTNLNKRNELKDGVGKKGYILIPENLNPEILNNIDFYLRKAHLIERGPKRKDRNLIKHKPRPGFFKKKR